MYLGYQNGKIKFYTQEPLDKAFYNLDKVEETELEYILDGDEYVLKDEAWEEKQAQIERERIGNLSLTRGDVFRGLMQSNGITRAQIRAMIENNETLTILQKEMALIDFDEALNFYRKNSLIDAVGLSLGITSKQLDKFFETNNPDELIKKEPIQDETICEPEPEVTDREEGGTRE